MSELSNPPSSLYAGPSAIGAEKLRRRLSERLRSPLPGRAAQTGWAPTLSYGRHFGPPRYDARHAAVMILLYLDDPDAGGAGPVHTGDSPGQTEDSQGRHWRLPLTLRPAHFANHAGQISLPGGVIEAGETSLAAALRELHEELGVPGEMVEPVGSLSDLYVFASNYMVRPWIGICPSRPVWVASADEVAQVWEVPLTLLLEDQRRGSHRERGGLNFTAPHFAWSGGPIWGATCLILAELLEVLRTLPGGDARRPG